MPSPVRGPTARAGWRWSAICWPPATSPTGWPVPVPTWSPSRCSTSIGHPTPGWSTWWYDATGRGDPMAGGPADREQWPPPGFRRFWLGEAVSGVGTWVSLLALQTIVVVTLGGGATETGWLSA